MTWDRFGRILKADQIKIEKLKCKRINEVFKLGLIKGNNVKAMNI